MSGRRGLRTCVRLYSPRKITHTRERARRHSTLRLRNKHAGPVCTPVPLYHIDYTRRTLVFSCVRMNLTVLLQHHDKGRSLDERQLTTRLAYFNRRHLRTTLASVIVELPHLKIDKNEQRWHPATTFSIAGSKMPAVFSPTHVHNHNKTQNDTTRKPPVNIRYSSNPNLHYHIKYKTHPKHTVTLREHKKNTTHTHIPRASRDCFLYSCPPTLTSFQQTVPDNFPRAAESHPLRRGHEATPP